MRAAQPGLRRGPRNQADPVTLLGALDQMQAAAIQRGYHILGPRLNDTAEDQPALRGQQDDEVSLVQVRQYDHV